MISRLRSVRLTWPQVAVIAGASALATAVILHVAGGRQHLTPSMLAALRERVAVHTVTSVRTRPPAAGSTVASAVTSTVASTAQPAAPLDAGGAASAGIAPAPSTPSTPSSTDASAPGNTSGADSSTAATSGTSNTPTSTSSTTPSVKHVFVIALTTTGYRAAFGSGSVAHYLNHTLRRRGTLLSGYRTLGGSELPDYLAMVSGQAPNADTANDCATYAEFPSSTTARPNGQVPGPGCVYPNTVVTIADQVTAAGKVWRAYLEDMGGSTCVHPDSNAADDGPVTDAGLDYATRHNPFIYFHSLLDLGGCSSNDVGLTHLSADLRTAERTPTYAFIAPGLCDEPSEGTCPPAGTTGPTGGAEPTGLAGEDEFLKRWVPPILASPAYKQNGVLIIVFARAPAETGSGPVRTGALVLSPLAKAGSTLRGTYNPYSVLRSVEDLLGYTELVHAKGARSFATAALPGA